MPSYDCIVVGAGYSGLAAAKKLKDAGKKVLLLEARNRVGGRAMTVPTPDGHYWDNGASFLGVQQPIMYGFVKEFDVQTFDAQTKGKIVQYYKGQAKTYSGLIPALRVWEIVDIGIVVAKLESLAKTVDLEEPWKTKDAWKLDRETLSEWMNRHSWTKAAKDAIYGACELIWGQNPSCISMLYALWYCKAGVSLTVLCTVENGAQQQFIKGGGQLIATKIHEQLTDEVVHLEEPVLSVKYNDSGAEVATAKGTYQARRVIFATPPQQVLAIKFEPPLPLQKRQLLGHSQPGAYYKVFAVYTTPFWREKGLRGEGTSPDGFMQLTNDVTPESGSPAKLMGFVTGSKAHEFADLSYEEKKEAVLKEWTIGFGKEASEPIDFHVHTMMEEEYVYGCPVATLSPGIITSLGTWWRKPIGPIHWAGTETSTKWCGYMEGACFSGQRAAGEVLEALKSGAS
jgi:monoamine oxidase